LDPPRAFRRGGDLGHECFEFFRGDPHLTTPRGHFFQPPLRLLFAIGFFFSPPGGPELACAFAGGPPGGVGGDPPLITVGRVRATMGDEWRDPAKPPTGPLSRHFFFFTGFLGGSCMAFATAEGVCSVFVGGGGFSRVGTPHPPLGHVSQKNPHLWNGTSGPHGSPRFFCGFFVFFCLGNNGTSSWRGPLFKLSFFGRRLAPYVGGVTRKFSHARVWPLFLAWDPMSTANTKRFGPLPVVLRPPPPPPHQKLFFVFFSKPRACWTLSSAPLGVLNLGVPQQTFSPHRGSVFFPFRVLWTLFLCFGRLPRGTHTGLSTTGHGRFPFHFHTPHSLMRLFDFYIFPLVLCNTVSWCLVV